MCLSRLPQPPPSLSLSRSPPPHFHTCGRNAMWQAWDLTSQAATQAANDATQKCSGVRSLRGAPWPVEIKRREGNSWESPLSSLLSVNSSTVHFLLANTMHTDSSSHWLSPQGSCDTVATTGIHSLALLHIFPHRISLLPSHHPGFPSLQNVSLRLCFVEHLG